jgi:hypothetical protein
MEKLMTRNQIYNAANLFLFLFILFTLGCTQSTESSPSPSLLEPSISNNSNIIPRTDEVTEGLKSELLTRDPKMALKSDEVMELAAEGLLTDEEKTDLEFWIR